VPAAEKWVCDLNGSPPACHELKNVGLVWLRDKHDRKFLAQRFGLLDG
jgi:hypothetical protein